MRSEAVFQARKKLEGRYQLCMLCAKGTRSLHTTSVRIQDTINAVLGIIGSENLLAPEWAPQVLSVEKCGPSDTEGEFFQEGQTIPIIRWDTWPHAR